MVSPRQAEIRPQDDEGHRLDDALMVAHAAGNGAALARLYHEAARYKAQQGEGEAEAFLLTQAYVFALESGNALASVLHARLKALGREA